MTLTNLIALLCFMSLACCNRASKTVYRRLFLTLAAIFTALAIALFIYFVYILPD